MDTSVFLQRLASFFSRFNNRGMYFLGAWALNLILILFAYSLVSDAIPSKMEWMKDNFLYFALLCSLVTALISTFDSRNVDLYRVLGSSTVITAVVIGGIVAVYIINRSNPTKNIESKIDNLSVELLSMGFTDNQVKQLEEILATKEYITKDIFYTLHLSDEQIIGLMDILKQKGLLDENDVIRIMNRHSTEIAAKNISATATAEYSTCYIELTKYESMNVYKLPSKSSPVVGYFYKGEQYIAKGRDSGSINEGWWLIEMRRGNKTIYGWVSSWDVEEINEHACIDLSMAPGY